MFTVVSWLVASFVVVLLFIISITHGSVLGVILSLGLGLALILLDPENYVSDSTDPPSADPPDYPGEGSEYKYDRARIWELRSRPPHNRQSRD